MISAPMLSGVGGLPSGVNGKASSSISIAHIFEQFYNLGGVHMRLRKHFEGDRQFGMDSRFVILWERQQYPQAEPRIYFMGSRKRDLIRLVRKRFAVAIERSRPSVAVYHTLDDKLFDLDMVDRRIFFLNNQWNEMGGYLEHMLPWADGCLSPSEPLCQLGRETWGEPGKSRVFFIPQPILPPAGLPEHPPMGSRPLRLGVCGRLVKRQKQVELLPGLFAHLERAGIDFRVEFLGDGQDRAWLENALPDRTKYTFHGFKEGADYWSIVNGWDVLVSTTKYEAGPITVLEAMSVGVIPVFPDIPCQGQVYIRKLGRPDLFFKGEDWESVAAALHRIVQCPERELESLRGLCRRIMSPHSGETYLRRFSEAVNEIAALPRISRTAGPKRVPGWDYFTVLEDRRMNKFNYRVASLFRRVQFWRKTPEHELQGANEP